LEERGIGRPSTYAPTISTIQERQYVEKEEKKLKPNALGMAVNDFLVENFSDIDDMPFTAKMEDEFDEIAGGKKDWVPVIKEFFDPFSIRVQGIYKNANRVKIQTEETDEKCDVCGAAMIVRIGKFGKFLACSKFPECKHTKPLIKTLDIKCPDDSGFVVIKKTKKGKTFYGCSNYPNCKWASWNKPK
jgi:DNA topoisomerase-1